MKKTRIAINGFGRIGRHALKIALTKKDCEVVAINDLSDPQSLAHLLKYDSVYGRFAKTVTATAEGMTISGKFIPVTSIPDPSKLPWRKHNVDVVLECSGVFEDPKKAALHLKAGARQVIISAPAKGPGAPTYVLGVNHDQKKKEETIINNASCTTNCIAPVVAVLHNAIGILKSTMTTAHAYTATQGLVDGPGGRDMRRGRAAAVNIVPTSTGAAKATTEAIPELKGLFDGVALRVPIAVGSISDIVMVVKRRTSVEEVNQLFQKAEKSPRYKGILKTTNEPIVSSDIIGDPSSAIVDLALTQVIDGDLVKVMAWYDNEWGYANRLVEQAQYVGKQL